MTTSPINLDLRTDLRGRGALVCGASSGIGRACAMHLARLGASCVLLSRDERKLAGVRDALPTDAGQVHDTLAADMTDWAGTGARVGEYLSRTMRTLHVLVNNTGGPPAGAAIDATPEQLLAAVNAQLIAGQVLVRALLPGMKAAGFGRIINITSTSVKQPIANLGISNIVRPAVAAWAKCLATELGPFGITANNVLPGYTRTERLQSLFKGRADRQGITPEEIEREIVASTPAGRLGEPDEVAAAVAFLASPAASYINGINLPVDGGRLGTL
ncbi:MAG: SDR family oxidoreductase [Planctomycetota bacterium]|nr:SDR family oxidoreductase [Planctomycetota bacterium]